MASGSKSKGKSEQVKPSLDLFMILGNILVDKSIDLERLDFEMDDKAENRETENDLKLQQMKEDKKDRIAKNIISVVGIAVPVVFGVWGTYKTFKFEENGTITSDAGRKYINNIFCIVKKYRIVPHLSVKFNRKIQLQ